MPTGTSKDRRGLRVWQPHVVVDDEDRSMFGRQTLEAALQLVPVGERCRGVVDSRRLDPVDVDLDQAGAGLLPGAAAGEARPAD